MPLNDPKEIGGESREGTVCVHCANPDGSVKKCEDIFEGGVQFFMGVIPGDNRALAERLVRKNMKSLPYWQNKKRAGNACLQGEMASDAEFDEIMRKM
jgi:hypothetical protein